MGLFKRKEGKDKLEMSEVKAKAEELIKKVAKENIPGSEKAKIAADGLVAWFDAEVDYEGVPMGALIDTVDGPILRFLLGLVIDQAYKSLAEKGIV
jgi:hypothetical protein